MIFTLDMSEKWIDLGNNQAVRVDYPTSEQKYKLRLLQTKGIDFEIEKDEEPDENGEKHIRFDKMTLEQYAKLDAASKLFAEYYLKYVIKEFRNIKTSLGVEVKAIIENNELNDEQWKALCQAEATCALIFEEAFGNKLRWNENDKKKFISEPDLETKVVSTDGSQSSQ